MGEDRQERDSERRPCDAPAAAPVGARVLLIGPSLRILGGQAVMADQLLRNLRGDGVAVDFLPINPKPPRPFAVAERVKGLRTAVVSGFYLASLLDRVRHCDVVHLFSASYLSFLIAQMPAILVARLYGKPVILKYRSGEAEDHLAHAGALVFALLRMCRCIVVPSRFLVDVFGRFGFEAEAIPNTVDPDQFRHRVRRSCRPRILVPRTLEAIYDVDCALRAFARIQAEFPDSEMTVLGDGSQEQALRQKSCELGLRNLVFAGRVERDAMGMTFEDHDLLLNSSSVDNMPVSLLEGFAAGLPIVTTDAGGIPAFIHDRVNGHVVPVADDEALAARVLELVRDPAEVERLSRQGAEELRSYVWPSVSRRWYALYARVAARPRGAS